MSHKQAKRDRKLYPHLNPRVIRERERLFEKTVDKAAEMAAAAQPPDGTAGGDPVDRPVLSSPSRRSSMASRIQMAALMAMLSTRS
jgi:hypothetical protein